MLLEVNVGQGLELLEGHVGVALLEGHHGVQLHQAVVQVFGRGGYGLVYGQVGLGIQFLVKLGHFEVIAFVSQRIRHGKEGLPAQIAVQGHLLHLGGLATGIAEAEAGQHLLHVLGIGLLPAVQEGFHPYAGGAHAAYQVVVTAQVLLLRVSFLGRCRKGGQGKEY